MSFVVHHVTETIGKATFHRPWCRWTAVKLFAVTV